jgi:hypothetical protein
LLLTGHGLSVVWLRITIIRTVRRPSSPRVAGASFSPRPTALLIAWRSSLASGSSV